MSEEIVDPVEQEEVIESNPEVEARALSMGWLPKDKFPGDPERWTPADEYVRKAEDFLPIARAQNRRYEKELRETKEQVKLLLESQKMIRKQAYDDAMRDISAKQAEAVSRGDGAAFQQLREMENKLREQAPEHTQNIPSGPPPEFLEWREQNPWYGVDAEMTEVADAYGVGLAQRGTPISEAFAKTTEHIKRAFPHKFAAPRQQRTSVEGGGRPASTSGKGYNNLPADAKAACDRFVKQKLMTREQYVKDFFGED